MMYMASSCLRDSVARPTTPEHVSGLTPEQQCYLACRFVPLGTVVVTVKCEDSTGWVLDPSEMGAKIFFIVSSAVLRFFSPRYWA